MILKAARDLQMEVVPEGGSLVYGNTTQIIDGHTGVEHALPVPVLYKDITTLFGKTGVGYTPTLRTFVNKIRNSGRPLVISSIDVGVATPEVQKLLASTSALVPAASSNAAAPSVIGNFFRDEPVTATSGAKSVRTEDKRVLVVPRKLSTFVVQVDYLSIPEEKPPAPAEGEPKK